MFNFKDSEPIPSLIPHQAQSSGNSFSCNIVPSFENHSRNLINISPKFVCSMTRTYQFQNNNDLVHAPPSIIYPTPTYSSESLPCSDFCTAGNSSSIEPEVPDFPDACLKFMNEILMEEDLDDIQDYRALQETEKSLYDALGQSYTPSIIHIPESPSDDHNGSASLSSSSSNYSFDDVATNGPSASGICTTLVEDLSRESGIDRSSEASKYARNVGSCDLDGISNWQGKGNSHGMVEEKAARELVENLLRGGSWGRKSHPRDEGVCYEDVLRSSKQSATDDEEDYEDLKQYDDVLLFKDGKHLISCSTTSGSSENESNTAKGRSKGSKGRRKTQGKKQSSHGDELVDLRTLLTHCAQAVTAFDMQTANELLKQIRQHSSPYGSSFQRIAHFFADGLEARIKGDGYHRSSDLLDKKISCSRILKAYKVYVTAIPFKRMSYTIANRSIAKLSKDATCIHIIDFGIFCGFQWPCFIQHLSERSNGPPKLRITGIDFPQSGFRPAKLVEETGRRLAAYCKRFNVPFEYHPIAQTFETIRPKDLKINRDEFVVVNCLYRSRSLFDETVEAKSPRDVFLRLVRKLNPRLFIHGVVNGSYNAPFFMTRFKELLFHYSCVFDLLEATIPREDQERLLIERELYGKAAVNVIACEGTERVERPESYRQWQVRVQKAGFRQLALFKEVVNSVKDIVEANYHRDFVVGQDSNWMLQGWKGRILYAVSCWKPA